MSSLQPTKHTIMPPATEEKIKLVFAKFEELGLNVLQRTNDMFGIAYDPNDKQTYTISIRWIYHFEDKFEVSLNTHTSVNVDLNTEQMFSLTKERVDQMVEAAIAANTRATELKQQLKEVNKNLKRAVNLFIK